MTEGQVRFQTLMENQRHNLQMERIGSSELAVKQQQADIAQQQADISSRLADVKAAEQKLKEKQYSEHVWKEYWDPGTWMDRYNHRTTSAADVANAILGLIF